MLENSNSHEVKDKSYEKRNGFGMVNYCRVCKTQVSKTHSICSKCKIEREEKERVKRKQEKRLHAKLLLDGK